MQSTRATLTVVKGYLHTQGYAAHDCTTAKAVHLACIRAAVASQIGARRALQGHLRET